MIERPILFSAPMVRAILDGTKTQTRRVLKHDAPEGVDGCRWVEINGINTFCWVSGEDQDIHPSAKQFPCPHGQPGDQLWVREAWARTTVGLGTEMVVYREGDNRTDYGGPWKPGIHMFRRDSRISLEITSVRVERLQDISRGDAMSEGCPFPNMEAGDDPRKWFADLWHQINGAESWDANPWVWVVEFKRAQPR